MQYLGIILLMLKYLRPHYIVNNIMFTELEEQEGPALDILDDLVDNVVVSSYLLLI